MLRRVLIGALLASLAVALAGPAHAATQVLMPNVSYARTVQFTAHGPVVLHVVTAPRPGGLYQLKPLLSNGTILGKERVTDMEKDVSGTSTAVGVNGDLFNWKDGHPSGMLMQNRVLQSPPYRFRSSVGIGADGKLNVQRVSFYGYWQGLGQRRPLTGLNQPPRGDGTALFTPAWGATTPRIPGVSEAVLQSFPPAVPGGELTGTVSFQHGGGGTPIPRNGAVLLSRGSQVAKLQQEAPAGTAITTRLILSPDWLASGVTDALGGGPLIVRNGKAVWTAGEDFLPTQLGPRNPRTAVGQRRDGKIILLAVDGRRRGYSTGMTNWELAQAMVRLGAVTASALDAGGSTTLAFDGKLLNRPSDPGGERPVAETLAVLYSGVYAPAPALPVVSPNGDGIAERQQLLYKIVRASTVTASLVGPGGAVAFTDTGERTAGVYTFQWPSSTKRKRNGKVVHGARRIHGRWYRTLQGEPLGRWRWVVNATDDQGQQSSVERGFWLNDTLGFIRVAPRSVKLRPRTRTAVVARFKLAYPARVTPSIWTTRGTLIRRLPARNLAAGTRAIAWSGRFQNGRLVYRGTYVFKVFARNAYGPVDLNQRFVVRR
ncbi:MAG TPA: phosphodiester glycosidase family protein [Gaiellaceae bacterium]|nr:phosphodiester glycosidase family protein [Gaiellaceae bacterium]